VAKRVCIKSFLGWRGSLAHEGIMLALGVSIVREYRAHLRRRAVIRCVETPDYPCEHLEAA